jgi:thioredoxin reductase (NADPH)
VDGARARPPVIVAVDDDPQSSSRVARDLRRRPGAKHRIVRAESGHEALKALKGFGLLGVPVALLVADYGMPARSGIEFLERALELLPAARRMLLTAYTDAVAVAVAAVNVVDLDHCLLKAWVPAEELLYLVLDELPERRRLESRKRVAPAVDDGAMAVMLVQHYLSRS